MLQDLKVRKYLEDELKSASVSRIDIERPAQNARITIHTARPGIVIGKKGEDVEVLRKDVSELMGIPVHINIEEKLFQDAFRSENEQRCQPAGCRRTYPYRHTRPSYGLW